MTKHNGSQRVRESDEIKRENLFPDVSVLFDDLRRLPQFSEFFLNVWI